MQIKKSIHLFFLLLTVVSCISNENSNIDIVKEHQAAESEAEFWLNSNMKYFKVDSTEFEVVVQKDRLRIRFEDSAAFHNQKMKLIKVIDSIKSRMDMKNLKSVSLWANNAELLNSISNVPEIQAELKRSEMENGIVNSMGIVSKYAFKANYLNELTSLFSEFNLYAYNYYIDKCHVVKEKIDHRNYKMRCATIVFKLKSKSS